ncbi:hypothetical protein JCM19992_04060 [Thermostilla marina]
MKVLHSVRFAVLCSPVMFLAGIVAPGEAGSPVQFEKRVLTDRYYADGINAGDIDGDGHLDVIAGPYWYEGPSFERAHAYYPPEPLPPEKSPSNCLYVFPYDFNSDGRLDILVLGRVHLHEAYWYENPGPQAEDRPWPKHFVFERIYGESPAFADLTGDGKPEIVCHWENRWGYVAPDWNAPEKPWRFVPLTEIGKYDRFYHGTGAADIDGDGDTDLIINDGWWEHPDDQSVPWPAHPFRFAARGGAQMPCYDIDGDGDTDVVTALDAHGWGLAWFEQVRDAGEVRFVAHTMMGDRTQEKRYGAAFSQPHALDIGDIDGDGWIDVVVGKRRWAHGPTGDIEPNAAPVIYWFRLERSQEGVRFRPYLVDDASGVGVQVIVKDVDGDGRPDILSASKLGTFVFFNRAAETDPANQR